MPSEDGYDIRLARRRLRVHTLTVSLSWLRVAYVISDVTHSSSSSSSSSQVFEAEASGGSKTGGLPHPSLSPFPPLPLSIPLSFQTNQWEGRSDPVSGKFPVSPPPYKYQPGYKGHKPAVVNGQTTVRTKTVVQDHCRLAVHHDSSYVKHLQGTRSKGGSRVGERGAEGVGFGKGYVVWEGGCAPPQKKK